MEEATYTIAKGTPSLAIFNDACCHSSVFNTSPMKCTLNKEYSTNVYLNDNGTEIKMNLVPPIKDVIFNDPATIVLFEDGTKTVVKTMEGQEFDPELGFLFCVMKRTYGEDFHKLMWKYCWGGQEARRAHRKKHKLANKTKDGKDDEASTTR